MPPPPPFSLPARERGTLDFLQVKGPWEISALAYTQGLLSDEFKMQVWFVCLDRNNHTSSPMYGFFFLVKKMQPGLLFIEIRRYTRCTRAKMERKG